MKRIARVALPVIFAISLVAAGSTAALAGPKHSDISKPAPVPPVSTVGLPPSN